MLYFAWYHDNYLFEMQAYQGISLNYYYLGQIKKATHYNERVLRGKSENENSIVRATAVELVATTKKMSDFSKIGSKRQEKVGFDRVPSPSGFC